MNVVSNVGLINILFYPGTSGTFLANIISEAIKDPWNHNYTPVVDDENYIKVNEYINPNRHLVDVWHTYRVSKDIDISQYSNTNWVSIGITDENFAFASVINAAKRQHKEKWTDAKTKREIIKQQKLTSNSDIAYKNYLKDHEAKETAISENNNLIEVSYDSIFVEGDTTAIKRIFDMLYIDYNNTSVLENIAKKCQEKHLRDVVLYNSITEFSEPKDKTIALLEPELTVEEVNDVVVLS